MTQEIFERLVKYEHQLLTATRDYVRAMTSLALSELDEIYQELFNQKSRLTNGCGHCVLNDMKRIAKEYFPYKEKLENEKKEEVIEDEIENKEKLEDEITEEVIENIVVDYQPEPETITNTESEDNEKQINNKVTNKDKKRRK